MASLASHVRCHHPAEHLQEVRGVLRPSPPPLPHGPCPHSQRHRPPHLVRPLGPGPEADPPGLHPLHLPRPAHRPGRPPDRGGLVEDGPALHGPDRVQHHPDRPARPGEERPAVLPREGADAAVRTVGDTGCHHGEDEAAADQPTWRDVPGADVGRR